MSLILSAFYVLINVFISLTVNVSVPIFLKVIWSLSGFLVGPLCNIYFEGSQVKFHRSEEGMNLTAESSTAVEQNHILFTDNTTLSKDIYISANVINIILGLPANCYIVWLMFIGKGTGFASDVFSLNLACGEIFYCLGNLVVFCVSFKYAANSSYLCFLTVIPIFARPLFLSLICVERYVAVLYPVIFLTLKPLRYRFACSVVVWVIVAGFGSFCMVMLLTDNLYVFICVVLPQYSLFLIVKLFCCLAVVRALKCPGPGERGRQREESYRMKRRAITVILILTAAMVVNYAPLFLAGFFYGHLPLKDFRLFLTTGVFISMIVAFVQPFLYIQRFGNLTLISRLFSIFTQVHRKSIT